MTFLLSFLSLLLLPGMILAGDEGWRVFTSRTGSTMEAKALAMEGDSVTLERKDGGKKITVKLAQLSEEDGAYLKELKSRLDMGSGEPGIAGIAAEPGKQSAAIRTDDGKWSYFVYLPKAFHTGRKWPVCFVMSPMGATNGSALSRYEPAAELLGMVIVLSAESKNRFTDSSHATLAMAEDVFRRFPVAEGLAFSSGMSGGGAGGVLSG